MYRLFEHKGKAIWITFLQDLVHSYNNTYHTAIKMAPAQVNRENEDTVFFELYPLPTVLLARGSSAGLNVGDYVRLLNPSSVFKKGYARQWTNEVFRIRMRNLTGAFALYKVEDLHGEDIEGFFTEVSYSKRLNHRAGLLIVFYIRVMGNTSFAGVKEGIKMMLKLRRKI